MSDIQSLLELVDSGDENVKFSDMFEPLELIGHGSFGIVIGARQISNSSRFAVKVT